MKGNFNISFDRLIGNEGGYCNVVGDSGGETNWGISKRAYPDLDIKALTRDDAKAIYKRDFWDHLDADNLEDGVSFQLFDFAVNSGIQTAIRAYQRALGVADDGHFGLVSKAAADSMSEPAQIIRILAERLEFMTRCSTWQQFGKGWAVRIAKDLRYGADDL